MKKWLKDWWFSIFCWTMAICVAVMVLLGTFIWYDDDDFVYGLLTVNALGPVLLLIIIGVANQPRKNKYEITKDRYLLFTKNDKPIMIDLDKMFFEDYIDINNIEEK